MTHALTPRKPQQAEKTDPVLPAIAAYHALHAQTSVRLCQLFCGYTTAVLGHLASTRLTKDPFYAVNLACRTGWLTLALDHPAVTRAYGLDPSGNMLRTAFYSLTLEQISAGRIVYHPEAPAEIAGCTGLVVAAFHHDKFSTFGALCEQVFKPIKNLLAQGGQALLFGAAPEALALMPAYRSYRVDRDALPLSSLTNGAGQAYIPAKEIRDYVPVDGTRLSVELAAGETNLYETEYAWSDRALKLAAGTQDLMTTQIKRLGLEAGKRPFRVIHLHKSKQANTFKLRR